MGLYHRKDLGIGIGISHITLDQMIQKIEFSSLMVSKNVSIIFSSVIFSTIRSPFKGLISSLLSYLTAKILCYRQLM